jgi:hypothetical protein
MNNPTACQHVFGARWTAGEVKRFWAHLERGR